MVKNEIKQLKQLNNSSVKRKQYDVNVLQFGEGNFLRAFVDWMIHKSNQSLDHNRGVVIVQPLAQGMTSALNKQDNLYHVVLEGIKEGKPVRETELVDCIMDAVNPYSQYELYREYFLSDSLEFVISNTTEAGISRISDENIFAMPPASFPGKITGLLYERFRKYSGAIDKGLTFICCELIENNADTLHKIVLELAVENNLEQNFINWINHHCSFCNSLVDRIVTGFPKDTIQEVQQQLNYEDNMVVTAEYYHLWAIQASATVRNSFPMHEAGLNVLWMEDLKEFRDKKVRVLNGSHTALVPIGLLAGYETVTEAFSDATISTFINRMISNEVLPTIAGDKKELQAFADEILERFLNPYIKHFMKDIALNSLSKWMTRNYPSMRDSLELNQEIPKHLAFSLASLILLYSPYRPKTFVPNDVPEHLDCLTKIWSNDCSHSDKVAEILSESSIWEQDLNKIPGLLSSVSHYTSLIMSNGVVKAIELL